MRLKLSTVKQIIVQAVDGMIQWEFDDGTDMVTVKMSLPDARELASATMRKVFEAEDDVAA